MEFPLAGPVPQAGLRIEIRVSNDSAFHYAFNRAASMDPKTSQTGYGNTFVWEFENLPALADELLAPRSASRSCLSRRFPIGNRLRAGTGA